MLKNYIKIAVRTLIRNKGFAAINVGGFAIGLACCLLIYVFVRDELSYDRFHENADQVYRVIFSTSDDGMPTNANGNFAVGPALKNDFPEVAEFARLRKSGQIGTKSLVRHEEISFYEEQFFFADSTFFDLFSFSLLQGDPETVLNRPNTVVITEETAQKYFGDENPIGKTLEADPFGDGGLMQFEVTGVLENIPSNSHIHFDFLASLYSTGDDLEQFAGIEQVYTYLLLREGTSEEALEAKLLDFLHRNWTDEPWYTLQLQPMLDIHLHSQLRSEIEANGNIRYVQIFGIIAVFVLVIASINFMNLMTARSVNRAKEVGMRKTAGAARSQLIRQFLTESVLLSLIAGAIALLLVDLFTPVFNNITGKEISVLGSLGMRSFLTFLFLVVNTGLLAGIYPAFVLSRFKPVETLKGSFKNSGSGSILRKGLVVFQFAISMALIAATGIVYSQLNYIQEKDLGYADDQIMVLNLNDEARSQYQSFRNQLLQHSGIVNTTTSSLVPTMGSSHNGFKIDGIDQSPSFANYYIDKEFVKTYDLKILAGQDVQRDVLGEDGGDFLFSEEAVRELGLEQNADILGRNVEHFEVGGRITGVVNDIHIYSFRENVYASVYLITPNEYHKYLSIRLNPANISSSIEHTREIWTEMFPGYPFDYFFLDESFEQMHRADMRLADTITWFALLAIFVASLGLFGLSASVAEQRVKEVGIRKVLGATVLSIVALFNRDFVKLVLLGSILAVPAAWYVSSTWLQDFAYKVDITAGPFILAGIILLLIAVLTISFNSIRAAIVNPVNSLRSE